MRVGFQVMTTLISVCVAMLGTPSARSVFAEEPAPRTVAEWVVGQIKDGRLSVEFYDSAKPPRPFPGWTEFDFRLEYRYDYQTEWTRKKGGNVLVVVTPKYNLVDVPITHRVLLPDRLKSDQWWQSLLARHELDHVRVGLHPRLTMLGKHLITKVKRFEAVTPAAPDVTGEWVRKHLDAEIAPRRDAVQALVLGINRKIDTLTNHGAAALPDREEFLANLYLKENLDELKFPYLPEVLDLIDRPEYAQARVQTLEVDIPAAASSKQQGKQTDP